jgi:hypothetical protein
MLEVLITCVLRETSRYILEATVPITGHEKVESGLQFNLLLFFNINNQSS